MKAGPVVITYYHDYEYLQKCKDVSLDLLDFYRWLRNHVKHTEDDNLPDLYDIYEKFNKCVDIDKLYEE